MTRFVFKFEKTLPDSGDEPYNDSEKSPVGVLVIKKMLRVEFWNHAILVE